MSTDNEASSGSRLYSGRPSIETSHAQTSDEAPPSPSLSSALSRGGTPPVPAEAGSFSITRSPLVSPGTPSAADMNADEPVMTDPAHQLILKRIDLVEGMRKRPQDKDKIFGLAVASRSSRADGSITNTTTHFPGRTDRNPARRTWRDNDGSEISREIQRARTHKVDNSGEPSTLLRHLHRKILEDRSDAHLERQQAEREERNRHRLEDDYLKRRLQMLGLELNPAYAQNDADDEPNSSQTQHAEVFELDARETEVSRQPSAQVEPRETTSATTEAVPEPPVPRPRPVCKLPRPIQAPSKPPAPHSPASRIPRPTRASSPPAKSAVSTAPAQIPAKTSESAVKTPPKTQPTHPRSTASKLPPQDKAGMQTKSPQAKAGETAAPSNPAAPKTWAQTLRSARSPPKATVNAAKPAATPLAPKSTAQVTPHSAQKYIPPGKKQGKSRKDNWIYTPANYVAPDSRIVYASPNWWSPPASDLPMPPAYMLGTSKPPANITRVPTPREAVVTLLKRWVKNYAPSVPANSQHRMAIHDLVRDAEPVPLRRARSLSLIDLSEMVQRGEPIAIPTTAQADELHQPEASSQEPQWVLPDRTGRRADPAESSASATFFNDGVAPDETPSGFDLDRAVDTPLPASPRPSPEPVITRKKKQKKFGR